MSSSNTKHTKHSKVTTVSKDDPTLFLLNEDVFNNILKFLDKECTQSLHGTCRLTHHWVKNLIPWMFNHIDRFPELRNEGVLNENIIHHMPLHEFIRRVRPRLLEYPEILRGFQTEFEDKARHAFEHDRDYETYAITRNTQILYQQKALALEYPNLNEDEVYEISKLLNEDNDIDLPYFLEHSRPALLKLNNPTMTNNYIRMLNNEIDMNYQIMQHNPDEHELEGYRIMEDKITLNRKKLYALENPSSTEEEITAAIRR
jgi:hypothetical protein